MVDQAEARERVAAIRWHHAFEVVPGVMTPGVYRPEMLYGLLHLPEDMSGLRVLDIGARDGYFSFTCEERGADVTAVDYVSATGTGFALARELRGSRVRYLHQNLYSLEPNLGKFDIVLFLGVMYHLPDPYLAMRIVRGLMKSSGQVFIESTCIDDEVTTAAGTFDLSGLTNLPLMALAARNESNFWDPNSACLKALCERASLRVDRHEHWGKRQLIEATLVENRKADWIDDTARGTVERG